MFVIQLFFLSLPQNELISVICICIHRFLPCFSMESMPESWLLLLLVAEAIALSLFSDVEVAVEDEVELLYATFAFGGGCEDVLGDGLEDDGLEASLMSGTKEAEDEIDKVNYCAKDRRDESISVIDVPVESKVELPDMTFEQIGQGVQNCCG